jgi:hypothetical protein
LNDTIFSILPLLTFLVDRKAVTDACAYPEEVIARKVPRLRKRQWYPPANHRTTQLLLSLPTYGDVGRPIANLEWRGELAKMEQRRYKFMRKE